VSGGAPGPPHLHHHPRGSLQRAAIRFGLLVALLGGAILAVRFTPLRDVLTAERLQLWFADLRGAWWAPLAHVGICVVVGSLGVPATPVLILGAAIFGAWWGAFWNWVGITLASVVGYLLARLLGREFVERVGGAKLKRAERLLQRRGFLTLAAIRFLPLPFSLINAAAAVVGVRFPKFVLASALGMALPIVILTYFSAALLEAATGDRAAIARNMVAVSGSAALLVFLPIAIRRRQRRLRLRALRARRAARAAGRPTPSL
jgi:phospholipase D1/2